MSGRSLLVTVMMFFSITRAIYLKINQAMTHTDAENYCFNNYDDGHLATIRNETENIAVFNACGEEEKCWIGLRRSGEENEIGDARGPWKWYDGYTYNYTHTYTNWYTDEPNNAGGNEYCVEMYAQNAVQRTPMEWNGNGCGVYWPFVCEYFTASPTKQPSNAPNPTPKPTLNPTSNPTIFPTESPSIAPTSSPTYSPNQYNESIENDSKIDYILWTLLSFVAIFGILTLCGYIYNEWPNSRVDDSRFHSIFIFGTSVFDFISDIILSREMVTTLYSTDSYSILLSVTTYASIIFIVLPYILNIIIAINIKRYIKGNDAAKLYFERHSSLFISLVILCGASYPVLSLLASRIFAKEIFNSGLSRYELRKLTSIKIYTTIIFENIPQLICQILYVIYLGGIPSENTILAFIASLLSIVTTILSHIINGNGDCYVIQYDLEMVVDHNLSKEEKRKIFLKKERKRSLRILLIPSLEIKMASLEFGYVTLTKKGCIIRCVHYLFQHQLQINDTTQSLKDSALLFIQNLYESYKKEVIESFAKHFMFDTDEVNILFHKQFDLALTNVIKQNDKTNLNEIELKEMYVSKDVDHDDIDGDKMKEIGFDQFSDQRSTAL